MSNYRPGRPLAIVREIHGGASLGLWIYRGGTSSPHLVMTVPTGVGGAHQAARDRSRAEAETKIAQKIAEYGAVREGEESSCRWVGPL